MRDLINVIRRVQKMRSELTYFGDTGKFKIVGTADYQDLPGIIETLNRYDKTNEPIHRRFCEKHRIEYDPQPPSPVPGEDLFQEIIDKATDAGMNVIFPGYEDGGGWKVMSGKSLSPAATIDLLNQIIKANNAPIGRY
jgi:hypothetical protein